MLVWAARPMWGWGMDLYVSCLRKPLLLALATILEMPLQLLTFLHHLGKAGTSRWYAKPGSWDSSLECSQGMKY
jgi:hypothetical protein